ncbi:hypothetical protein [Xanthomonas campestris]|uniref:hypothetical protein n=1 Tax=Xanthomonas campestris TaxID=339 RepID=UPI002B225261|nr:hypothetical protein [Xanthomonas campestris]
MDESSSLPTFEPSALQFLMQWVQKESRYHESLTTSPDAGTMRRAMAYFKIARTFKGLKVPATGEALLKDIKRVARRKSSPEARVQALANLFMDAGFKHNISAASKLIWLNTRDSVIYDSRAVDALKQLTGEKVGDDYKSYCILWRETFTKHRKSLVKASKRLVEIHEFLPMTTPPPAKLKKLAGEEWFLERVFDVWLWSQGSTPVALQAAKASVLK